MLGILYMCAVSAVATMLWRIFGSAWFDIAAARVRRQRRHHPGRAMYRTRPAASVVVLVSQQDSRLANSLASFRRNTYKKCTFLVVGYGISRRQAVAQRRLVQASGVAYYHCRTATRQDALKAAMRRRASGDIVVVLDAGTMLRADTVRRGVCHFQDYPQHQAVMPRVGTRPSYRVAGVVAWYLEVLQSGLYKADAAFGVLGAGQPCLVVRRSAQLVPMRAAYDPTIVIEQMAPSPLAMVAAGHRQLLRRWRQMWQLWRDLFMMERSVLWLRSILFLVNSVALGMVPLVVGYSLYVAVALAQPQLLFVLVGGISVTLAFALLDQPVRWWQKCLGLLGMPLTFGTLVLAPLVAYAAYVQSPWRLVRHRHRLAAIVLGK